MKNIRNFCIIAHIDHGKSTWPTACWNSPKPSAKGICRNQVLDDMDLKGEGYYDQKPRHSDQL